MLGLLYRLENPESSAEDAAGQNQFKNVEALSEEQEKAMEAVLEWLKDYRVSRRFLFTLAGYAGTGKTTLIGLLAQHLQQNFRIAFCTLTGKASGILERSLRASGVTPAFCGTIHRLMYRPDFDLDGRVRGWVRKEALEYDLVVVDEASMVSSAIMHDLSSFMTPILAVGDHGQLPPIGEDVGLMMDPDVRLEQIRRQALDNPILAFAHAVRSGGDWRKMLKASTDDRLQRLTKFGYMKYIMSDFADFRSRTMTEDPLLLCRTNKTRMEMNEAVRSTLRTDKLLIPDERVICLRNAYIDGMLLANGFRGRISSVEDMAGARHLRANLVFPDEGIELRQGALCREQFGREQTIKAFSELKDKAYSWDQAGLLFDYGYCLTGHKAQGSQSRKAVVFVERLTRDSDDDFRRWLYTCATRPTHELAVVEL